MTTKHTGWNDIFFQCTYILKSPHTIWDVSFKAFFCTSPFTEDFWEENGGRSRGTEGRRTGHRPGTLLLICRNWTTMKDPIPRIEVGNQQGFTSRTKENCPWRTGWMHNTLCTGFKDRLPDLRPRRPVPGPSRRVGVGSKRGFRVHHGTRSSWAESRTTMSDRLVDPMTRLSVNRPHPLSLRRQTVGRYGPFMTSLGNPFLVTTEGQDFVQVEVTKDTFLLKTTLTRPS